MQPILMGWRRPRCLDAALAPSPMLTGSMTGGLTKSRLELVSRVSPAPTLINPEINLSISHEITVCSSNVTGVSVWGFKASRGGPGARGVPGAAGYLRSGCGHTDTSCSDQQGSAQTLSRTTFGSHHDTRFLTRG